MAVEEQPIPTVNYTNLTVLRMGQKNAKIKAAERNVSQDKKF